MTLFSFNEVTVPENSLIFWLFYSDIPKFSYTILNFVVQLNLFNVQKFLLNNLIFNLNNHLMCVC